MEAKDLIELAEALERIGYAVVRLETKDPQDFHLQTTWLLQIVSTRQDPPREAPGLR